MARLERELCGCRCEVYLYMRQHDAAWLETVERVEAHVHKEKAEEAPSRRAGRVAAAAAREAWLQEKVEASVFAPDGDPGSLRIALW
jgi:hypothetical protein